VSPPMRTSRYAVPLESLTRLPPPPDDRGRESIGVACQEHLLAHFVRGFRAAYGDDGHI
ncbi:hypothetical protein AVEN_239171-1, partial [Araneus ventricosus]